MNVLLVEIKRSLAELDSGLKGSLTMTAPMELLMVSLANDMVPLAWKKLSSPSLRGLASWFANLLQRYAQLAEWTGATFASCTILCLILKNLYFWQPAYTHDAIVNV